MGTITGVADMKTGSRSQSEQNDLEKIVVKNAIEFDALEKSWNELVQKSNNHIFQTFEWNRIWWKHFGVNKSLQIILFYDSVNLVGIIPFFIDEVKAAGITGYKSLRFIGSNVSQPSNNNLIGLISYSDYLDFIIEPGYEEKINLKLIKYFRQLDSSFSEIILNSILNNSSVLKSFLPEWKAQDLNILVNEIQVSQKVIISESWDKFLMTVSKNTRSHSRRALKRIEDSSQKIFDVQDEIDKTDVQNKFDKLVDMHQSKWNRFGSLGTFAEKTNYEFHKEIAMKFFEKGWLQIKELRAINDPDQNIAMDLNYVYNKVIYGVHCAVDEQSEHYQNGPGSALLCATLKEAIQNGFKNYDFLRGDEHYKKVLANSSSPVFDVVVQNPNIKSEKVSKLFHNYSNTQRRAKREKEYFKLLMSSRPLLAGLREYSKRLSNKIKQKN